LLKNIWNSISILAKAQLLHIHAHYWSKLGALRHIISTKNTNCHFAAAQPLSKSSGGYANSTIASHFEWSDLMGIWGRNLDSKSLIVALLCQKVFKNHIFARLFTVYFRHQISSFKMLIYTVFQVLFAYIHDFCPKNIRVNWIFITSIKC
jgi:hypothetical protein